MSSTSAAVRTPSLTKRVSKLWPVSLMWQYATCFASSAQLMTQLRSADAAERAELFPRYGTPGFAWKNRLQRLCIFIVIGQQQLVAHPKLFQQLASTRALRGQVNEVRFHSRW